MPSSRRNFYGAYALLEVAKDYIKGLARFSPAFRYVYSYAYASSKHSGITPPCDYASNSFILILFS
ncbi:hypothetical protein L249_1088 [Ophiocordyceps polyrhachis-furcata BCC 54312]|uniref:Uncharacterized protein n=1 Tax=Ophiocordyceps polyrhachis-furcata BCC 54312 TaxID=1330021 RepID=A0A367LEL7_9HYPO|nr:hypothetical protein L249_1088 [Ophiocordyceps polyrhachis-furcata BCC 54312]